MTIFFESHNVAFCLNCGGDFGEAYWYTKDNSFRGRGLYEQCCVKCDAVTSYDLLEDAHLQPKGLWMHEEITQVELQPQYGPWPTPKSWALIAAMANRTAHINTRMNYRSWMNWGRKNG